MSLESTWDLAVPSQPRSFCVCTPHDVTLASAFGSNSQATQQQQQNATNPFEAAAAHPSDPPIAQAIVVGTEQGSLHFRAYAPVSHAAGLLTGDATQKQQQQKTQPGHNPHHIQAALGISKTPATSISPNNDTNLPRAHFPVDFSSSASRVLGGPVVTLVGVSPQLFLALVDDHRGTSGAHPGAFVAHWITLSQGRFGVWQGSGSGDSLQLPRMSCAVYHPHCGIVYAAGRQLGQIAVPEPALLSHHPSQQRFLATATANSTRNHQFFHYRFGHASLLAPGARSGPDAMAISNNGSVVVVAVGNSFVAMTGIHQSSSAAAMMMDQDDINDSNAMSSCPLNTGTGNMSSRTTKLISFAQSSQVHPVLCLDVKDPSVMDQDWSCWFMASSRACSVVDFYNAPPPRLTCSNPRGGTVTLASPILAAATSWPWLVVLTSDGLLSVRSPSCLAIALRTVEVGTRPNDYFSSRTLVVYPQTWIVAISYAGHAKVLQCLPDTAQELADRFMRLAIDALGANGFPRAALAEAVHASFTATSYVGPEPTPHSRYLFKHYLEAILGLMDLESGATTSWLVRGSGVGEAAHHGSFGEAHSHQTALNPAPRRNLWQDRLPPVVSAASPPSLLTGTALLCLVCASIQPTQPSLANRAAKACVNQLGMIVTPQQLASDGAVQVCESVADILLQDSTYQQPDGNFSLLSGSSPKPIVPSANKGVQMEFVEAAVWLLRSCGKHERAMQVLFERMQQQKQSQSNSQQQPCQASLIGGWSQIKYDSCFATHLSELWGSGRDEGCHLVLKSEATRRLLEHNPRLGLSAFTALHPQNPAQWKGLHLKDDPVAQPTYPRKVLQLLQSVQPVVPYGSLRYAPAPTEAVDVTSKSTSDEDDRDDSFSTTKLPLESGRALAVTFLESALGIATGRPLEDDEFDFLPPQEGFAERLADFHDELAFLLLEGIIAERGDTGDLGRPDDNSKAESDDTPLGRVYRSKLRRLLRWPLCKVRSDRFLLALPRSFLQERAFVLGNLGRHADALKIFVSSRNWEMELM